MTLDAILTVVTNGGQIAITAIFAFVWWEERKWSKELENRLLSLAVAQTEAMTNLQQSINLLANFIRKD